MKKIVSIFLSLILLLVFSGCGDSEQNEDIPQQKEITNENSNQNEIEEEDIVETATEPEESGENDRGLLEEATSGDLDITKCDSIQDDVIRNFCIKDITTTLAKESNDISKCDALVIEEDKEYCRNAVTPPNSEI